MDKLMTFVDVASQLGVTETSVRRWFKIGIIGSASAKNGRILFTQKEINERIILKRGTKEKGLDQRALDMAYCYQRGEMLGDIGSRYGITRERVRQILVKQGIRGKDGGAYKQGLSRSAIREKAAIQARENYSLAIYGMGCKETSDLSAELGSKKTFIVNAYRQLRDNSNRQKIPWSLTLKEFFYATKDKPYGLGNYVLRRIDQSKGYEPENIIYISHSDNSKLSKRQQQIFDLYNQGEKPCEIAKKFGIKSSTVNSVLTMIKAKIKRHGTN